MAGLAAIILPLLSSIIRGKLALQFRVDTAPRGGQYPGDGCQVAHLLLRRDHWEVIHAPLSLGLLPRPSCYHDPLALELVDHLPFHPQQMV